MPRLSQVPKTHTELRNKNRCLLSSTGTTRTRRRKAFTQRRARRSKRKRWVNLNKSNLIRILRIVNSKPKKNEMIKMAIRRRVKRINLN